MPVPVPIDHRATIHVLHTDLWFDMERFMTGICVMVGSSWVVERRRGLQELMDKLAWPD